jgi:hypothetical protein
VLLRNELFFHVDRSTAVMHCDPFLCT